MPASRRVRAMILAPRSCPSKPGFATTTRIGRLISMRVYPGRAGPGATRLLAGQLGNVCAGQAAGAGGADVDRVDLFAAVGDAAADPLREADHSDAAAALNALDGLPGRADEDVP